MPTFESRTGIGKPKRRRQKPVAAPSGPPPARQRATPKAKRTPPAVVRKRATIPGQGLPHVSVPGAPKHFQRKAAKRVGPQAKLKKLTKLEQARENLAGQGYTPPKYGPAGQQTTGEKIVTALTGVSPTSQQPGSIENAVINTGLALTGTALEAKGVELAAKASSAASKLRTGSAAVKDTETAVKAAQDAEKAAQDASKLAKQGKAVRAARRVGKAAKTAPKRAVKRAVLPPKTEGRVLRALAPEREGRRALSAAAAPFKAHTVGAAFQGYGQALVEHPGEVAKSTVQTAPGLFTAPLGAAVNVGISGGRAVSEAAHAAGVPGFKGYTPSQIKAPAASAVGGVVDFNKELVNTVLSGDPAKVEAYAQKTGLTVPIMLALAAQPATRGLSGKLTRQVRRKAEELRAKMGEGKHAESMRARGMTRRRPEGKKAQQVLGISERRTMRREEAQRAAVTTEHKQGETHAAMKKLGHEVRAIKGRQGIKPSFKRHPEDYIGFFAERGIHPGKTKEADAIRTLEEARSKLPEGSNNHELVSEIIAGYDLLTKDKHFQRAVTAYFAADKMLRARRATGDERSVHQVIAQQAGIALPEERFPLSVEHLTKAKPQPGVEAKGVLLKEAHGHRVEAKRLKRKAQAEIRGHAKALEKAHRRVLIAQRSESRSLGGAEVRVSTRDRKVLARQKDYVAAVKASREANAELRQARAQFAAGRGAYHPRENPAEIIPRIRAAEARVAAARAAKQRALADVRKRAELAASKMARGEKMKKAERDLASLHRAPPGGLRGLERRAATVAEAQVHENELISTGHRGEEIRGQARQQEATANMKESVARMSLDEKVHAAFLSEVKQALADRGLEEPAWMRHVPVGRGRELGGMSKSFPGSSVPAREKFRKGSLSQTGNVDYSYPALVQESIFRRVTEHFLRGHVDSFVKQRRIPIRVGDQTKTVLSGEDIAHAIDSNQVNPRHVAPFAVQAFERAVKEGDDAKMQSVIRESLAAEIKNAKELPGRKYILAPREALTEFLAQMDKSTGGWAGWRKFQRLTSRALLGTSPAWAISQPIAEGIVAAASVSPYRLLRGIRAFHSLEPQVRRDFSAQVEGAAGGGLVPEIQLSLRARTAKEGSNAYIAFDRTTSGRYLKSFATAEPLIAIDRWKANFLRHAVAAGKVDRDLNGFLSNAGRLYKSQSADLKALKGLPLKEQLAWYADHPDRMGAIAEYTRNTMGSWTALTRYERKIAPLVMFYPFLRFSLRTVFRTFPREHPVKAAILWNLAAANTQELKKLLGGDPNFVQTFADTPIYTGPGGSASQLLPLSRVTPGSNVLTEAGISPETQDVGAFLKVINPLISIPALTFLNHDPVSGRPLTDKQKTSLTDKMKLIGAQLLSLPAAARAADYLAHHGLAKNPAGAPVLGAPSGSPFSQLFRAIGGPGQTTRSFAFPFLPVNLTRQQTSERVSRLLDQALSAPKKSDIIAEQDPQKQDELNHAYIQGQKAWNELDAYLRAYKIETKAQQKAGAKKGKKAASRGYKITAPSSSSSGGKPGILGGGGGRSILSPSGGKSILGGGGGASILK